jgi:hypothetical protein
MSPHGRQRLAFLAMVVAGVASLATSQGPPGIGQEPKDRLTFASDHPVQVRHVRIRIDAGAGTAYVRADVPIQTGGVGSPAKRPVTVTVVRDSDGKSIGDDLGPGYLAGAVSSLATSFVAIGSCAADTTCEATFTLTFERIPEDTRESLEFEWSVRTWAEYPDREAFSSPPPGAALSVEISR